MAGVVGETVEFTLVGPGTAALQQAAATLRPDADLAPLTGVAPAPNPASPTTLFDKVNDASDSTDARLASGAGVVARELHVGLGTVPLIGPGCILNVRFARLGAGSDADQGVTSVVLRDASGIVQTFTPGASGNATSAFVTLALPVTAVTSDADGTDLRVQVFFGRTAGTGGVAIADVWLAVPVVNVAASRVEYALNVAARNGLPAWDIASTSREAADSGQRGTIKIVTQHGGSGQTVARDFKKYMIANGWMTDRMGTLIPRGQATDSILRGDSSSGTDDIVNATTRRGAIFSVVDEPYVIVTPLMIFESLLAEEKKAPPDAGDVFTSSHARFGNRVFFGAEDAETAEGGAVAVRVSSGAIVPIDVVGLTDGTASVSAAVTRRLVTSGSGGTGAGSQLAPAVLTTLVDTISRAAYPTASITPAANALVLAIVTWSGGNHVANPTLTGNSLTWELVEDVPDATVFTSTTGTAIYRALGTPTAGALTATFASARDRCQIHVLQFVGVDTGGTNGSGAVVQAQIAQAASPSVTVPLNAFAALNNATFAAFLMGTNNAGFPSITPGSGMTELTEGGYLPFYSLQTEWAPGKVTAQATGSAGTNIARGIALEIKAGAVAVASFQTDIVVPTANNLQLLAIYSQIGSAVAPSSVTGNGFTWVQVGTGIAFDSSGRRCSLYRALVASPTSGRTTITFAAAQNFVSWSWVEFANVDTGGTNGSAALAQVVTNSGTGTALLVTLAAFGAAGNAAFGFFAINGTGGITEGTGFTELHDVVLAGELMTEWKNSSDITVDASAAVSVLWAGIAVEIKATSPIGAYVTGEITPSADKLQMIAVFNTKATTPDTPTVSGCNMTWTSIATVTLGTMRATLFRATGSDPSTGTLNIDFAAVVQVSVGWSVFEVSGVDIGTAGADAIVQFATATATTVNTLAITLSAFAQISNGAIGAFFKSYASGWDESNPDFTEIHDPATAPVGRFMTEWSVDEPTGDIVDGTDISSTGTIIGIAVELARSPSAAGDYSDGGFAANYLTTVGSRMFRLRYDSTQELWYESWTDELGTDDPEWSTEFPVTGARRSSADLRTVGPNPVAGISGVDQAAEFLAMDTEGAFTPLIQEGMGVTNVVAGGAYLNGQVFLMSGTPRALWFRQLLDAVLLDLDATPPDDTFDTAIQSDIGGVSGLAEVLWVALNNQILYGRLSDGEWSVNQFESFSSAYRVLAVRAWPDSGLIKLDVLLWTSDGADGQNQIFIRTYLIYNGFSFPTPDTDTKTFRSSIYEGDHWVTKKFQRARGYVTVDAGTATVVAVIDGVDYSLGTVDASGAFAYDFAAAALGRGIYAKLVTTATGAGFMGSVELPLEFDYFYQPSELDLIKVPVLAGRFMPTRGGTIDFTSRDDLEEALRDLAHADDGVIWTLTFWDERTDWSVVPVDVQVKPLHPEAQPGGDADVVWLTLQRL